MHDTPEHNGIAERAHRTLLNAVRSLLISSGLPKWLWGYMMQYSVYVWNRTPKKANNLLSPYQKRYGKIPDISNFHIFGSIVFVKREKEPDKLGPQTIEGQWIGLEPASNGHYIYWTDRRSVTVERNVVFSSQQIQLVEREYDEDIDLNLDKSITELDQPILPVPE